MGKSSRQEKHIPFKSRGRHNAVFTTDTPQTKHPVSFLNRLPYNSLTQHVNWIDIDSHGCCDCMTLAQELEQFACYVQVRSNM